MVISTLTTKITNTVPFCSNALKSYFLIVRSTEEVAPVVGKKFGSACWFMEGGWKRHWAAQRLCQSLFISELGMSHGSSIQPGFRSTRQFKIKVWEKETVEVGECYCLVHVSCIYMPVLPQRSTKNMYQWFMIPSPYFYRFCARPNVQASVRPSTETLQLQTPSTMIWTTLPRAT